MFFNNRKNPPVLEGVNPNVGTITTVRENIVKIAEVRVFTEHEKRLAKFNTALAYHIEKEREKIIENGEIAECLKANIGYPVKGNIIKKFKYYAGVNMALGEKDVDYSGLRYVGDIPDFALTRIENFILMFKRRLVLSVLPDAWLTPLVTIHSNIFLPVEHIDLHPIDPVVIGWKKYETGSQRISYNDLLGEIGFVLAVWDNDKELEI